MHKWFFYKDEQVIGPFSTDDAKSKVSSGEFTDDWRVWGRLQDNWQKPSAWQSQVDALLSAKKAKPEESTENWYYAKEGNSHGPMTRTELVSQMTNAPGKGNIVVWTTGMKSWVPLLEVHELADEVGIEQREYQRAPIAGQATIKKGNVEAMGQLVVVSEGGCGVTGFTKLIPGEVISLTLKSDSLNKTISVQAEVRYNLQSGLTGLKFEAISMEDKSELIDYVKEQTRTQIKSAA